ncbi:polysaccharide pyruvyl transferase family protein [Kaistia sp. 32K]|uniref:polysaccharide pyruvyl transferase family protein n=1 Tax=Kaistia sp. 32K TaxID=2795690 RepID=UPI001915BD6C|nr:polysaccharide pyruvyl transferase family protein [Kaistia sp. 32K]
MRAWLSDWIASRPPTLFLIPSDPWNLTGSIGDAAMIAAVTEVCRTQAGLEVTVLTSTDAADQAAHRLGLRTVRVAWDSEQAFWPQVDRQIRKKHAKALLVLGADVLDGGYGSEMAKRMLRIADLAASRRIPTAILGFSFNSAPAEDLRPAWAKLHPDVVIQVRDQSSLQRFEAFSGRKGTLVADCAFLLKEKPGQASEAVRAWTDGKRQQGRHVLGINFHPQLFKKREDFPRLGRSFETVLRKLAAEDGTAFVVIPHDNREDSDKVALRAFAAGLDQTLRENVLFVGEDVGPDEIKAIVSHLDGTVTGRMHLAIATLGMGRPAVALTYQDKFEGLFDHFDLPSWLLVTPEAAGEPEVLLALIRRFRASLGALTSQVQAHLPAVQQAARRNLDALGWTAGDAARQP